MRFLQHLALMDCPATDYFVRDLLNAMAIDVESIFREIEPFISRSGNEWFIADVRAKDWLCESIVLRSAVHARIAQTLGKDLRTSVEHRLLHAHHAAAAGDASTAFASSIDAADAAFAGKEWAAANSAFRLALSYGFPSERDAVRLFRRYLGALRAIGDFATAELVAERAIDEASDRKWNQVVLMLAVTLIAIKTENEDFSAALHLFERYLRYSDDSKDISEIRAAAAAVYANAADLSGFDSVVGSIDKRSATTYAIASVHQSEAILAARIGDHDRALRALDVSESYSVGDRSTVAFSLPIARLAVEFEARGVHGVRGISNSSGALEGYWAYYALTCDFAAGRIDEVIARLRVMNTQYVSPVQRRLILSLRVAINVLRGEDVSAIPGLAEEMEIAQAMPDAPSAHQLTAWTLAAEKPAFLGRFEHAIKKRIATDRLPGLDEICFSPIATALYAIRHNSELAEQIANREARPSSRWICAQNLFATGLCRHRRSDPTAEGILLDARELFSELGAELFSAFAGELLGIASSEEVRLLDDCGVRRAFHVRRIEAKSPSTLTRRENEVAHLAAIGNRNREIAAMLSLSERTVEVHLANTFEKLGIRSRVQLSRHFKST